MCVLANSGVVGEASGWTAAGGAGRHDAPACTLEQDGRRMVLMRDSGERLPLTITRTRLWRSTLAVEDGDPERVAKQDLHVAFGHFREKARLLAAEIPRYLPEFTDHSIDHLDALWEIADLVIGESLYQLNPAEAFVFGGAVLVHDCAMSLAAYPGAMDDIEHDPAWEDTVAFLYLERFGVHPSRKQLHELDEAIRNGAVSALLRLRHAERAEGLTGMAWMDSEGEADYLIDNKRLRNHFGEVIGKVAHSHHWSVERLTKHLPLKLGTLGGFPPGWEIDPLKVACLLRIADACHLDERRAPAFLRAIRDLPEFSDRHWRFQNRLGVPIRDGDSLVFSANKAFRPEESASWWLCYDTLTGVDRELREVDALLGEQRRDRLGVRRVAGAGAPERLAQHVRTTGWQPVDARLFIGDVPRLIERLGGEKLYGDRPWVAVRELLQNATDAVRARRFLERLPKDRGAVTVSVEQNTKADTWYLHVEDNGIGMSATCIREYLLNFGGSYWTSDLVRIEHPGLIASGIKQSARFGIGFFSTFMVGTFVRVVTRQLGSAAVDTVVLEFSHGPTGRPVLRSARADEQLRDSGTLVSVRLSKDPFTRGGIVMHGNSDSPRVNTASGLIEFICPTSDVTIQTRENGEINNVIVAEDWKYLDPLSLGRRIEAGQRDAFPIVEKKDLNDLAQSMTFIYDNNNEIGRASLYFPPSLGHEMPRFMATRVKTSGYVTTSSGFRVEPIAHAIERYIRKRLEIPDAPEFRHDDNSWECEYMLSKILDELVIHGVLQGEVSTITRDEAHIPTNCLASWATEQGKAIRALITIPHVLYHIALRVELLGGEVLGLPIASIRDKWYTEDDIKNHLGCCQLVKVVLKPDITDPGHGSVIMDNDPDHAAEKVLTTFYGVCSEDAGKTSVKYDSLFDYLSVEAVTDMEPSKYLVGFIKYVLRAACQAWEIRPRELRNSLPLTVVGALEPVFWLRRPPTYRSEPGSIAVSVERRSASH